MSSNLLKQCFGLVPTKLIFGKNSFPQEVSSCLCALGIWFQGMMCWFISSASSAPTEPSLRRMDTSLSNQMCSCPWLCQCWVTAVRPPGLGHLCSGESSPFCLCREKVCLAELLPKTQLCYVFSSLFWYSSLTTMKGNVWRLDFMQDRWAQAISFSFIPDRLQLILRMRVFFFCSQCFISINSVGSYLKNKICFCSFIDEQNMFHKHVHSPEETIPKHRENDSERKRNTHVYPGDELVLSTKIIMNCWPIRFI